jgi:hypothetical protein
VPESVIKWRAGIGVARDRFPIQRRLWSRSPPPVGARGFHGQPEADLRGKALTPLKRYNLRLVRAGGEFMESVVAVDHLRAAQKANDLDGFSSFNSAGSL